MDVPGELLLEDDVAPDLGPEVTIQGLQVLRKTKNLLLDLAHLGLE